MGAGVSAGGRGRLELRRLLPVLAAGALAATGAQAAGWPNVVVSNYGTYAAREVANEPDPQAPNGERALVAGWVFLEETRDICARIGVNYGFELRQLGNPPGRRWLLDYVIDHPPVLGTDGRVHRHESYTTHLGDAPDLLGWEYRHTNTLVAGDWTWTVTYRGALVTRQTFHVHTDCPVPMV